MKLLEKIMLFGIAAILSAETVSAQQYNCPGGMIGGFYGGGVFSWILFFALLALIAAAVYWLIKSAKR